MNEITVDIIKNAKDGENIRSLAAKIGFAYSAVYRWVAELEKYQVISLIKRGNNNVIKINKDLIYKKFIELDKAISVIKKDKIFWELIKNLKLKARFTNSTAATIWTKGSFITGDFYDRIYFLEADKKDAVKLKNILKEYEISYTEDEIGKERPLVYITQKDNLKIEKKDGLPVMPLQELINWCKKLHLENILEQLNLLYNLKLKERYSEIYTNIAK